MHVGGAWLKGIIFNVFQRLHAGSEYA